MSETVWKRHELQLVILRVATGNLARCVCNMEVIIEAKRFCLNSLVGSVLFRVEEVGRKWRQVVDLKLPEAVWIH